MNPTLPAPRDLPPSRHAEMRAELVRTVSRPARRSRLFPAVAAAAAIAVVAAAVLFLPSGQHESVPPASVRTGPPDLPPGVTLEERAAIEQKCAPDGEAVLYNLISDEFGRYALLYGDDRVLPCAVDLEPARQPITRERPPVPEWHRERLAWLPGAVVHDIDLAGRAHGGLPAYDLVLGRVRPDVARVTLTRGGWTVDAVIVNDTFIGRLTYPGEPHRHNPSPNTLPPYEPLHLHGYDADGNLLDTLSTDSARLSECYRLPDGRIVLEGGSLLEDPAKHQIDPADCAPATRWRR